MTRIVSLYDAKTHLSGLVDRAAAGADCGFSSQATYQTEVHPTVIWAKFEALRDGAAIASRALWG